ncbi:MAG: glycolate oxidase subunit GlcF [Gammaproteobacteria bacterium]
MHTRLADFIKEEQGRGELEAILRSCVHCGFCNATCPTYRLLGDELDGPRGRIYLLKQVLEGRTASRLTQKHLDRCLTCRSCETTCPSGVQYSRLLDAGRVIVDEQAGRAFGDLLTRYFIIRLFSSRQRFGRLLTLAGWLRPLLPLSIRKKIPSSHAKPPDWPRTSHPRKMLILPGCVQPSLAPSIDASAARVLDKLGISLLQINDGVCCGALPYHLSAHERALALARKNIDISEPYWERGFEAIVSTASGCGVMAKDYGRLLKNDPVYAGKAAKFSAKVKDIGEVLAGEDLTQFKGGGKKIAFQSPCTLQHGLKLGGLVESILEKTSFRLTPVADPHLCCGSAGVYSLLESDLSGRLLAAKLQSLQAGRPELIATANVGCLHHLRSGSAVRVVHWIELLN